MRGNQEKMNDDWYVPQTRSEWAKHKRELAEIEKRIKKAKKRIPNGSKTGQEIRKSERERFKADAVKALEKLMADNDTEHYTKNSDHDYYIGRRGGYLITIDVIKNLK